MLNYKSRLSRVFFIRLFTWHGFSKALLNVYFFQVCQDATVVCMLVTVTGKYQPGTSIPRKENVKNLISLGVVEVIIDLPLNMNVMRVVVFVSTTVRPLKKKTLCD